MRGAEVEIPLDGSGSDAGKSVSATWTLPLQARGVVVFAHGSGSGRFSPRNRAVAAALERARFGTLLLDLLTADEEEVDAITAELRFDIPFLTRRLLAALDWLGRTSGAGLPVGIFGASTGAAVALVAAAERPELVEAVVSRGGRPDLAGALLPKVRAPTLLIVGGNDDLVLELNERAAVELGGTRELYVVPGATHLFEEAGALERVIEAARAWYELYLQPGATAGARP
jgi:putative phosphoribosyl transferase